jgi:acetyl esterase/lipase
MASLANVLAEAAIRAHGTKRMLSSEGATRRAYAASQLRPARFGPPRLLERTVDLAVRSFRGWPIYSVTPKGTAEPVLTVVYLHGGAYTAEITPMHWRFIAKLAREANVRVEVPIYPLAPTSTADKTVPGAAAFIASVVELHGVGRVVVMGDSAGGGLALAAALELRDADQRPAAALILLSPWLDVTMSADSQSEIERRDPFLGRVGLAVAGQAYSGDLSLTDPRVSPLFGDLGGLPPITVLSAGRDLLCVDADRLCEKAHEAGIKVDHHKRPGLFHVYPLMPTPEGIAARRSLAALLRNIAAAND